MEQKNVFIKLLYTKFYACVTCQERKETLVHSTLLGWIALLRMGGGGCNGGGGKPKKIKRQHNKHTLTRRDIEIIFIVTCYQKCVKCWVSLVFNVTMEFHSSQCVF